MKNPLRSVARALGMVFGTMQLSYRPPRWVRSFPKPPRKAPKPQEAVAPEAPAPKAPAPSLGARLAALAGKPWVRKLGLGALGLVGIALIALAVWAFSDRRPVVVLTPPEFEPTELSKGARYPSAIIEFSDSAASIALAGKTVGEGISIDPPIKGSWKWSGDQELVFSPSEDWRCDQEYRVTLSPSIMRDDIRLSTWNLGFRTKPFELGVSDLRFEVNPLDDQDRRVRASLVCNYPVDPRSLEGKFEIRLQDQFKVDGKDRLSLELGFDEFMGTVYLKSPRLPIPKDSVTAELVVQGGIRSSSGGNAAGGLSRTVKLPGLYERVRYLGHDATVVRNQDYAYERIINLEFSGELTPGAVAKATKLWLLPKDRVGVPGMPDERDHQWDASEIGPQILAKSTPLALRWLPTENATATLHSFVYDAPVGRMLYLDCQGEVPAFGGYLIKEPYRTCLAVPAIPRSLEIMHNGSILSLGGDKTISVVSNDVETVRFRASRLFPDQVNHLITQTGGSFEQPWFRNSYSFNELNMSTVYSEVRQLPPGKPGAVQYQAFDFSNYLQRVDNPAEKYGLFLLNVSEYDIAEREEFGESSRRFILVTNLGMLAKRNSDDSYEIFVQDIQSGLPRSGAMVSVLGRNGLPVFQEATNGNGQVHVPPLSGFERERQAVVFTVESQGDMSFLPLNREDRFLEFSRFDVGGEHGAGNPDKLTAFLFSDRALYRPGDKLNLGYIVRSGDWSKRLVGLPLELKLYDPRGVEVLKQTLSLPEAGFGEWSYRTLSGAATGSWRIELALVREDKSRDFLGSCSVRVEEFVPDRLSISSRFLAPGNKAWVAFDDLKAQVHLMNLYGMPAAGNQIQASFQLSPRHISFDSYPEYRFDDAFATDKYYEESLPPVVTDEKGDAELTLDLTKFEPATFQLSLRAEGLEKQGGRGVLTESTILVSPLRWIMGWKVDGRLDYISKGGVRQLELVAIDADEKPVAVTGLRFALDELQYVSVLTKQDDDSYRYQSVRKKFRVKDGALKFPAAGLSYRLDTETPGDYEFTVLDERDRVVCRVAYSVIGRGNLSRSLERNAELQIKLDKADYSPGEEIEIQIKAPYAGSGLITIERDRVYASQWFRTEENASIQRIRVPEGVEGNAYVNVSFIRAIDSREIYMSPLSYGVAPFRISLGKRQIGISLETAAEAKPGRPFTIKYATDRPSRIVLFAVDEGILQLARYQTPDPLPFFFRKRALEVGTSQILDLILPEYRLVQEMLAMGGDGDALQARQNPFKRKNHEPVAWWSGILEAGPDAKTASYTIPAYFNGTLRVMAVAVSDAAMGRAERKAIIRNDFIITPTLPLFVAPGDEFLMGVTVAHNAKLGEGKAEIALELSPSAGLAVVGAKRQTVKLERNTEGTLWFRVKAGPEPGAATMGFRASSGAFSSDLSEGISIRPATPWRESLRYGDLGKGETTIPLERSLLPDFRKANLDLSYSPGGYNQGLLSYLADYPYGCSEQIISRSFPAMLLLGSPDYRVDKAKTEASMDQAFKILRSRQSANGGIGLWSDSAVDPYVTVYAGHFLTEASKRGYRGADALRNAVLRYLDDEIARDPQFIRANPSTAAYAAWVLTLNGKVATSLVLDVREALQKTGGAWRQQVPVLFLAGAHAELKQQKECDQLLADYRDGVSGDYAHEYDSRLYRLGLQLTMNARYLGSAADAGSPKAVKEMVDILKNQAYSTSSANWAILAFQAMDARAAEVSPTLVQVWAVSKDGKETPVSFKTAKLLRLGYADGTKALRVVNTSGSALYWGVVETGFDRALPDKAVQKGFEVYREFQDDQGRVLRSAKRGDRFFAVVKIRSSDGATTRNVALTELLPGGLELALDQESNRPFEQLITGSFERDYAEAREDRVLVFGTVTKDLTEFRYPVKAVTAGSFTLPPASAEAMYEPARRAASAAGHFEISE